MKSLTLKTGDKVRIKDDPEKKVYTIDYGMPTTGGTWYTLKEMDGVASYNESELEKV